MPGEVADRRRRRSRRSCAGRSGRRRPTSTTRRRFSRSRLLGDADGWAQISSRRGGLAPARETVTAAQASARSTAGRTCSMLAARRAVRASVPPSRPASSRPEMQPGHEGVAGTYGVDHVGARRGHLQRRAVGERHRAPGTARQHHQLGVLAGQQLSADGLLVLSWRSSRRSSSDSLSSRAPAPSATTSRQVAAG